MDLLDHLRAYGADITTALERFVGDEALYVDCFHLFLGDACFADLGAALARKDAAAAFEAAHSLKGLSGNLGLTPMYQETCAMVEPLRHGELTGVEERYARILKDKAQLEEYG